MHIQGFHIRLWTFPELLRDSSFTRHESLSHLLGRHCGFVPADCHRRHIGTFVRPWILSRDAVRWCCDLHVWCHDVKSIYEILPDPPLSRHLYGIRMRCPIRPGPCLSEPIIHHSTGVSLGYCNLWCSHWLVIPVPCYMAQGPDFACRWDSLHNRLQSAH